MSTIYNKTTILNLIKERKEVLFGSLKHPKTNEDRHAAWKEVFEKAVSLGAISSNKDWTYVRDTTWANWKRSLMKKRDNKGKTGKGGGVEVQYTATDNLILDIIGRDTPILEGLPVPESMSNADSFHVELLSEDKDSELISIPSSPTQVPSQTLPVPITSTPVKGTRSLFQFPGRNKTSLKSNDKECHKSDFVNSSEVHAKRPSPSNKRKTESVDQSHQTKKFKLQLELMEIDKRIKTIELFKLEQECNLPASEYTKELRDSIITSSSQNL